MQMDLEIRSLSDQNQVDLNNVQQVRIFTDGSKIGGRVGAALSLWNNEVETKAVKLSLPAYCTVYQAELLAICRATSEILKNGGSSFGLYSDSRAALKTVTGQWNLHPLAVEIRRNLHRALVQNKMVFLFWIKAHTGLPGNERADCLAKEAALSSRRKPDYDQVPVSFVKRNIREKTLAEWNRRYQSGGTASVTRAFFPDAVKKLEK
ncbi:ribonuclease H-like [Vanessa atalanta]|uniref:ribonuclease H-like n=1 Tax=Vanessa atalanta TaxID=42275 RepID=UPI001FCD8625|nr:ribonuclease H-like [Vanessa atalanta]